MSDLSSTLNSIATPTRISGLSGSGLDVDGLVTKLMQPEQIKYDKMKQDEIYTEWKRDAYRDIMTKVKAFTDKYLQDTSSNTDPNNLLYAGNYSVFSGTTTGLTGVSNNMTGANITATGGAGTSEGTYHITVNNVATKATTAPITPTSYGVGSTATAASGSDLVTFSCGGKTQQFNIKGLSVGDALSNIGSYFDIDIKYSSLDGKYHINSSQAGAAGNKTLKQVASTTDSTEVPAASNFLDKVFGQHEIALTGGNNASVTITEPNGATATVPQTSNNFKVDGVTYDISKATDGAVADITMSQNVDDIYKKITGFIDDYNGLIKNITDEIHQKKTYSYKPLTDTQKKSMTTEQIKQWEDAGKVGILSNDSAIQSMLTSLRNSFFDSVKESGLTLNDLGLSTYGYPDVTSKAGQINYKADTTNPNKLKDAIKKYGDRVGKIFAKKSTSEIFYVNNNDPFKSQAEADRTVQRRKNRYEEEGIFYRISDIFQDYLRPSNGYGTISRIAGTVGYGNENTNILADQIKDQKNALDDFQTKMNQKENDYYQKFSKLEAAMAKASSQQQWLQSQLR